MPATTDGNQNYKRYSDTPGVLADTQPASTPGTVDPGDGWKTYPYLNFNGDYEPRDEDNQIRPQGTYQKRDEDNNPITPQPYERN